MSSIKVKVGKKVLGTLVTLKSGQKMNTKDEVLDFRRKVKGFSFSDYVIDEKGMMTSADADSFKNQLKNFKNLTEHEKMAVLGFVFVINKKYGVKNEYTNAYLKVVK